MGNFIIKNTSFVLKIFVYFLFIIYFYLLFKKNKTKVSLNNLYNTELTKEEQKMLDFSKKKYVKVLIPKQNTNEYKQYKQKFDKISGYSKYKTLDLFFAERAYYTIISLKICLLVEFIPIFLFLFQKILKIENPILIKMPSFFHIILLCLPILVYLVFGLQIKAINKERENLLKKDVISLGILINTMLETGNDPYDILVMVKDIKPTYKNYIELTLNEYFVDTKKALINLKEKIGIPEMDMVIDSLIFAYETDNIYASKFLNEYIERLEETTKISGEKRNKIKPYVLLVSSIFPLISGIIIWFYPWMTKAAESLSIGF